MTGVLDGKVAIVTGTSRGVGVGIAHELLRAGATVIGCSRSQLDALPGQPTTIRTGRRGQRNCLRPRRLPRDRRLRIAEVVAVLRAHRHPGQQCGRHRARSACRGRPRTRLRIQGAPRSDDDYERTVLFHAFAIQMNLISPLWFAIRVYRQMRTQDGTGCDHQHLQRRRPSRRVAHAGLLRRGEEPGSTTSPAHWPQEWGPQVARQLHCAGPDDHRELPLVRAAQGRPDRREYFRNVAAAPRR